MLVVNCGSRVLPRIIENLNKAGHEPTIISLDLLEPHNLKGHEGIIISGSPRMVSEQNMDYIERLSFLRNASIPILAICFGHQLIGALHGAEIRKSKPDKSLIRGHREIWLENSVLFNDIKPVEHFFQYHEEEISLPEDFILLGSSEETSVEAMCHKEKPIYAVQFHPELSGDQGFKIFENFSKLCKERSMAITTDSSERPDAHTTH